MDNVEIIKSKAREGHVPIVQDKTLEFITLTLTMLNPSKILELGTAVGYSSINMCKTLLNLGITPKITTIEISQEMVNVAKSNIKQEGLEDYIQVINQDAEEYMRNTITKGEIFDYIFIDAAKGQYVKYLQCAMELTQKGACILSDNVLFKGKVLGEYNERKYRTIVTRLREYLAAVTTDDRLYTNVLDIGDGIAISMRVK